MERKLAAILAADVVGYSALMERDEAGTFDRLKADRKELFEPEIKKRHGRIFKLMGDGLLAEFGSVVDAVECAVSLQRGLAERNANGSEDARIQVRIGVNLGEVIVDGKDRYGDGVNIAARLQQLAEPGGIWVSGKVVKEVQNKTSFGFEPTGVQRVKNIAEPVTIFQVKMDGVPMRPIARAMGKPSWLAAATALAAAVVAALWLAVVKPTEKPTSTIPVIAVLPFDNMSGDASIDYLGDGVADDIITMLSRFPGFAVIGRNSSFAYKGKQDDVRKIGSELGAGYLLVGSVRKEPDQMRIIAQLVDTTDGRRYR